MMMGRLRREGLTSAWRVWRERPLISTNISSSSSLAAAAAEEEEEEVDLCT